jgi:hypothetical protein
VVHVRKARRNGLPGTPSDLFGPDELIGMLSLEQELRFIRKINDLLGRGLLIGGGYRHIEVRRLDIEHDLDDATMTDRGGGLISDMMAHGRKRAGDFLLERGVPETPSPCHSVV